MKFWIFNNYNTLPEHGQFTRSFYFGKNLRAMGHEPVVFAGSHPHNSDVQLIEGPERFRVFQEEPFPWVLIKTAKYGKSRKKRVLAMFQFYRNGKKAAKWAAEQYGKPDAILGSSAHPLAALLAVRLGKKYHCRSIVEIRDLWPESIVAYGIAEPHNPAVIALRHLEKWLYTHAYAVVFTMEGAYNYIKERGWEKDVPRSKVYYINNGVDLESFRYDREHFQIDDPDLKNPDIVKVVYVGSIRRVNNLGLLLDAAKKVDNPRVKFLIWGGGDELPALKRRLEDEHIENVVFKGYVEKTYVPYIVSQADINLIHSGEAGAPLMRFGISPNKMFDCFAAEKFTLMDLPAKYNPLVTWEAGIVVNNAGKILEGIQRLLTLSEEEQTALRENARRAAEEYDYKNLTRKLLEVIGEVRRE